MDRDLVDQALHADNVVIAADIARRAWRVTNGGRTGTFGGVGRARESRSLPGREQPMSHADQRVITRRRAGHGVRPVATRLFAVLAVASAVWTVAGPASAANPTLHFHKAYVNSPGADTGSNTSLNAEYVVISNASSTTTYKLTGYTVRDRSGHVYRFPTFSLRPGTSVTVHTGSGTNTGTNLYWGSRAYIWTNSGDTAYLKNSVGTLKDSCAWGSVSSYVYC
jgi:hypothetical protein